MDWKHMLQTLNFKNQHILDNQVEPIATIQLDAFVIDREWQLSLKRNSPQVQFVAKALLVGRLQQARTERTMYFDRGANDPLSEVLIKKFAPCLCVSVVDDICRDHVCSTPTLNSATSGFKAAASSACEIASRVSIGSMILSIHRRAAP